MAEDAVAGILAGMTGNTVVAHLEDMASRSWPWGALLTRLVELDSV
jgi:hypothetical protein